MIVITELGIGDEAHVPFNAGFLAVVRSAFPLEQILFVGAVTHIEQLKLQLGRPLAATVKWKNIAIPRADLSYFRRLMCEMKMVRNICMIFSKDSGLLLLTSVRPSTVAALKLVTRSSFRKIKAQVILHGHLSGVSGTRYRRPIRRFQEMRTALTFLGNRNLQYIVLEESVRQSLIRNLPGLAKNVAVVDHPLPPSEAGSNTTLLCNPIRFGFLGLASESKGFATFVKLASMIVPDYQDRAEFHAIGRLGEDLAPELDLTALTTKPGKQRMSRSAYIEKIKKLHFIVLPHRASPYELTSSGTLLDAIAWGKPLIARKVSIFENVFSNYGDIGYLFSSDVELTNIVQRIVQFSDESHYRQQVVNTQRAQRFRAPDALAKTYRRICERVTN